jgi:hypothetical protein
LDLNKKEEQNSDSSERCADSISIKSDNSVAVIDNMQAYDLDEDWYSDESFADSTFNDSKSLPKSVIPKTVMNPALSYMLENSGLTQDQIMKIVAQSKKNKKLSDDNSSQGSSKRGRTTSRRSLRNKIKKKIVFDNPKIKTEISNSLETISESDAIDSQKSNNESQEIKSNVIKSNDFSERIIIESSDSESNDFIEISEQFNIQNQEIKMNDSKKILTMESSDSECNDFIEIQDVPILELIDSKKLIRNSIEITIKPDENLQDDIFADVFDKADNKADTIDDNKSKSYYNQDAIPFENDFSAKIMKKENMTCDEMFSENSNKDNEVNLKFQNEQIDFCDKTSLLTCKKDNPNIEINSVDKTSTNLKNSEEATILEEIISETDLMKTNIAYKDNETHKDSVVDDVEDSEINVKMDAIEQSKNEKMENENNATMEIPKVSSLIIPADEKELESMKVLL